MSSQFFNPIWYVYPTMRRGVGKYVFQKDFMFFYEEIKQLDK